MGFLKRFWNNIDGNKIALGGVCLGLGMFIEKVILGIWGVSIPWVPMAQETCEWIGGFLVGGGSIHRLIKRRAKKADKASK